MRADSDSSSSNNTELLACRDGSFTLSHRRGGHAQLAVDGDEAVVLHQDFKARWTLLLDGIILPDAVATIAAFNPK